MEKDGGGKPKELFHLNTAYYTGPKPPRGKKLIPEGYEWTPFKTSRTGQPYSWILRQIPDPEGPPNFTEEELRNTTPHPPENPVRHSPQEPPTKNWNTWIGYVSSKMDEKQDRESDEE